MKIRALLLFVFSCVMVTVASPVSAQSAPEGLGFDQTPLCLPEGDSGLGQVCQAFGPVEYFAAQEQAGIEFPIQPLPALNLVPVYSELPFNYVRLSNDSVPIFSSLDDAITNNNPYQYISTGPTKYASYVDTYQGTGSGRYYMIDPGMWIRGGSTSGRIGYSDFVGLEFSGTPNNQFGWVIYQTDSYTEPGGDPAKLTGHVLNKFDQIQVFGSEEVNGVQWHLIGPDEWVDSSVTALVYPASDPPAGVTNGRWIEVNLYEQTIAVYQSNRLVFATLTSTGIPGWWTQPGLFQIREKVASTPMSGSFEANFSDYYYLEDVPWTMYFDQARALHGAYWHNLFGYEQSHGCVNLSPGDARWLFGWADVGDFVYVWDPSGQTPTDPSLYTAGGA
jgi:hypothetical protein